MNKLIIISTTVLIAGWCTAAESAGILPIPDYTTNFWDNSYLLGDLGGMRTSGAENGIQADIQWTQIGQSVTDGGRQTGSAYGGNLDYNIRVDLDKMGVLPGGLIISKLESRYGESVNGIAGPLLPVNLDAVVPITDELDENIALTVTALYYMQFLSEKFAMAAGKFETLDGDPCEFASGRGTRQFMNFNLNFSSTTAFAPYSTLGIAALYMPSDKVMITCLFGNQQDSSTSSGFDEIGEGWIAAVEMVSQFRLANRPGGLNVGTFYAGDGDYTQVDQKYIFDPGNGLAPQTSSGTWTIYATFWQYLYTEKDDGSRIVFLDGQPNKQGLGFFMRSGIADKETNPARFSASVGLGGRGILPRRDDDLYGFGVYYVDHSDVALLSNVNFDDQSSGCELFYSIAITPAMHLTLDAQYVTSPGPLAEDSTVLGTRLNLVF